MIGAEVFLDREPSDGELASAFGAALAIPASSILVVDDIASVDVEDDIALICETTSITGDFVLSVSLYPRDGDFNGPDRAPILGRVCGHLECRGLVAADSADPYSMILIENAERVRQVSLDPARLEELGEYVLKA